MDYRTLYEKEKAAHEKYKGYFKKEKAKQKDAQQEPTQEIDINSIEAKIMQKVEFYQSHPEARELKADIDGYVSEGMDINRAFKLAAADKNPSLLIDQQTKAQEEAKQKELTGLDSGADISTDFSTWTDQDAAKASDEDFEKYWEFKKRG